MSRKKTSPFEDLADLVATLPWWAGVVLAVASYLVLHSLTAQPGPIAAQPGHVGAAVIQTYIRALAFVGQYAVPLVCLTGAAVSAWRRHARRRLLHSVAGNKASVVDGLSWQEFEQLIGEVFRSKGYRVSETGGGGADGGIDLVLGKDGETHLVQCKQWRALRVGVNVVRELYGVMAAKGAASGFVVTSGSFTDEARGFAEGRNVAQIDGTKLQNLLQQAKQVRRDGAAPPAAAPRSARSESYDRPSCPVCSRSMVRRSAKRGANAGVDFWGCSGYPSCKGTRAVH
jgi:restriction system protein